MTIVAADRFWDKVDASGDCWEWTGHITTTGYGRSSSRLAHRVAYELLVGPIPSGLTIDHLCRNRGCVNPDHMEAVTKRENTLRGISLAARNAQKTHCPQGHAYTPVNTYVSPLNQRVCRVCHRAKDRRYKARARRLGGLT